jgi:hypothetical protein
VEQEFKADIILVSAGFDAGVKYARLFAMRST